MESLKAFVHLIGVSTFLLNSIFLLVGCGAQDSSTAKTIPPIKTEKTLAEDLLELESQYRDIPPETFDLLQKVLDEGVAALGNENAAEPKTSEEAISAFEAVSRVLAKHNFFQPTSFDDTPDTLGQALTPKKLTEQEIDALLTFKANEVRAREYVSGKPIYLVDCDMASLIILGVFDRLGWDTRLVRAPTHMFLRWRLLDGTTVNWDWTNWDSYEDEIYLIAQETTAKEQIRQGTYLRSLSINEAKGNFIGLIGSNSDDNKIAKLLLEQAIELAPNNPTNLNNLAWVYATDPDLALDYSEVAVMYAHRAVAADLLRVERMGTLACAYAADGQWELAIAITLGLAHELKTVKPDSYFHNLDRIKQHKLCQR